MKKLGLIQSRGIGDIVIALPIAKYYHDRGWKVYWPIDRRFLPSFQGAVDYVEFIPFDFAPTLEGFLMTPMRLLKALACDHIVPLYSHLTGTTVANADLAKSLKFDEYKYAIAGVPFEEKWNIQFKRDEARERAFLQKIVRQDHYIVVHRRGSNFQCNVKIPPQFSAHQLIEIDEKTDCIFDWLQVLEGAKYLMLIDSCFANLVEQLGLPNEKTFILRSEIRFTPVLRSNWQFVGPAGRPVASAPLKEPSPALVAR